MRDFVIYTFQNKVRSAGNKVIPYPRLDCFRQKEKAYVI